MKKFTPVSHTADIALQLESDTLEGLLTAGAEGMMDFLKPGFCQSQHGTFDHEENIELTSLNATTLLIDFLSEVLTWCLTEYVVACELELNITHKKSLTAKVNGYGVDAFDEDIKGVTYHDAEIRKNEVGNYETLVIFDI